MFLQLDMSTQLFLFTTIALASFFLATAMDGVLGVDGFGVIGNQIILVIGFYLGVSLGHYYGYNIRDFKIGVIAGLIGSFVIMFLLSIIKALLNRFF